MEATDLVVRSMGACHRLSPVVLRSLAALSFRRTGSVWRKKRVVSKNVSQGVCLLFPSFSALVWASTFLRGPVVSFISISSCGTFFSTQPLSQNFASDFGVSRPQIFHELD